ncbi:MAG TPA: L,D-transpeptidase [Bryobacteraceae bacterium]|nr:L,D-transpeptidase [Bryobacteraceae bacterium]
MKLLAILAVASTEVYAEETARRLVISIPDRKLALIEDGRVVKVYRVAVGKPSTPSPRGTFHIVSHVQHPTWYQPGKIIGPGPANPLGTRWMGLGYKGYGIHGTNMPLSIGKAASHGCIRMRNHDVEELFSLVKVGDQVELTAEIGPELAQAFGENKSGIASTGAMTAAVAGAGDGQ